MPWTTEDVEKHNKGLSDSQKKQWVAVANSSLKVCMDKGGSESTCAASAIRQANGVVKTNENYKFVANKISGYKAKVKNYNGTQHYIVPVTMIVEGVLNGSHGPLLHLAEDFGKVPESWNGIPVMINHPEVEGMAVSANSPEVLEQSVGKVFNAKLVGNKLKAEVWADETKLTTISPDTLSKIIAGTEIEVSVGVFTDDEDISGTYNGTTYSKIARNHKPDHLALLPCGVGACSLTDGCGIRANQKNKKGGLNVNEEAIREVMRNLNNEGFAMSPIVVYADGLKEKLDELRGLVNGLDSETKHHYLEEAYDNYVIYEQYTRDGEKLFKHSYSVNSDSGEYAFVGEPIEVEKEIKYVTKEVQTNEEMIRTKNFMVRTKFNNNSKKESTMAEEKCTPCVKERVDKLIANKTSGYTEEDRGMLETLNLRVLDSMLFAVEPPKTPKEETVQVNAEKTEIQTLSQEDKAALDFGKRILAQRKADMIAGIQKNTEAGTWSDDELKAMSEPMLEKLYKTTVKEEPKVDYTLNGNSNKSITDNAGDEILPLMFNLEK